MTADAPSADGLQLFGVNILERTRPVEKLPQYWFYFYGFNFAIVAGLFASLFGWLLDRLAASRGRAFNALPLEAGHMILEEEHSYLAGP